MASYLEIKSRFQPRVQDSRCQFGRKNSSSPCVDRLYRHTDMIYLGQFQTDEFVEDAIPSDISVLAASSYKSIGNRIPKHRKVETIAPGFVERSTKM